MILYCIGNVVRSVIVNTDIILPALSHRSVVL